VEEQRDIVRKDVDYAGVTRPPLWPHGIVAEEEKRLDSTGAVKWCCKK
jgi:hypothetical protein